MNKFLRRANRRVSFGGAATLLIITMFMAQLLGFVRTMMVNGSFPAIGPQSTDAYFAAFKIPDFFFLTLAAGALGVALIPILAERLEKNDRHGVWEISNSLMNLLAIIMTVVGFLILIFATPLMHLVAPKLSPSQLHNAVTIMRIVSFNPLLFMVAGVLTGVQQTFGRFFFFAIGPLIYNASIIVSIFLFRNNIGLIGLGIGAVAGAALQLVVAGFGLYGLDFHWRPHIYWANYDFRQVLRLLPPRSIDQGVDAINSIVETNRARNLGEGYLTYYENAYALHLAPILLIGTTISTAIFPRLSERLAQKRPDLFRADFDKVLRILIWVSLPVVIICYFCRGYMARLIFKRGAPEIALLFGLLSIAIFFRIIYTLFSRYFYAHKDTVTPLLVSIFAIGLNVILAFSLTRSSSYGFSGLALAQSIVAAAEVGILLIVMLYRDRHIFSLAFLGACVRIFSVTGFTMLAAFIMLSILPLQISDKGFFVLGTKLVTIIVVTFGVHLGFSALFGLDEARIVIARIRSMIFKPMRIQ